MQLGLVAVLVVINALLAGSELALVSLRDSQVARLEERGTAGAVLAKLAKDPNQFLATIQVGITLSGFLASATAAVSLAEPLVEPLSAVLGNAARPVSVVAVTLVLTYVTLVFGELAPKRVAMQRAEGWALLAAKPLSWLATVSRPAVWLLGVSTDLLVRMIGLDPAGTREEVSEEELREMVAVQPELTEQERNLIDGAFEFADRRLREILVPRVHVVAMHADVDVADAAQQMAAAGHTRVPLFDVDLDDVVGTVHLRSLVGATGPIRAKAQPPLLLPDSLSCLAALRRLQAERQQMAIVLDEHGGTEGIITVEDLVEELVGEIWDEADPDVAAVERQVDGGVAVVGSYPIHDLPDIGIDLPHGDYTTVAGLLLAEFGRVPGVGETVVVEGWVLTIVAADERVVERVEITRAPDPTPDASERPD